jgi:hypothetical protein
LLHIKKYRSTGDTYDPSAQSSQPYAVLRAWNDRAQGLAFLIREGKNMNTHRTSNTATRPKMRVVDIPANTAASEVEALINAPCEDGYYQALTTASGLPEGINLRLIYKLRVKPERDE